MESLTDNQLMLSVRAGDINKMAVLFERHHKMLYNYFTRMTAGNIPLSDDLVQEVFLRMLKYRDTYTGEGTFVLWMYRIARHTRIDHYKKWHREDESLNEVCDQASGDMLADEVVHHHQNVDLLQQALLKLSQEKREVLILSRYQNMRYNDIAALLDCSAEAVRVKIHRAMNDLRRIFFHLSGESHHE